LFHESLGLRSCALTDADFAEPTETAARILRELGLLPARA
jgi:hypothetical protein